MRERKRTTGPFTEREDYKSGEISVKTESEEKRKNYVGKFCSYESQGKWEIL